MHRIRTIMSGVAGSPYYTNMYFVDDTAIEDSVLAVGSFWQEVDAYISNDLSWTIEDLVPIINPVSGQITGTFDSNGAGGQFQSAGEMVPRASQLLISWRTGQYSNGRELRGRTFIPCVFEGENANGVPQATTILAFSAAAENLRLATTGSFVVWSPTHGVNALVQSHAVWNQWAVLRSRRD